MTRKDVTKIGKSEESEYKLKNINQNHWRIDQHQKGMGTIRIKWGKWGRIMGMR